MIRNREFKHGFMALLTGLLVMALVAPVTAADREVKESGPAAATGTVMIENISGSIVVVGWDKAEISVEGTLSGDIEELKFKTGKKKCRIEVVYPRNKKNVKGEANLVINVPHASRLEVECISAFIEVSDVTGLVDVSSISGDVTVTGECEGIEAESISGNVFIEGGAPEIEISSISGKVKANGTASDIEAGTVSGDIDLAFDKFLGLNVESVAGDATVKGDLAGDGYFSFDLHSGYLTLTVPGDVSADFEIETFSGEIDNDFGQKSRKTSKYAPGRELEFTTGGGEARVRISTFSGDVVIRTK
ncbi:MAG: DUF4097 family beta strand repeat protein [Candidatus Krumholzibacteria bacterium]|nr:DUF4097 family beta strand repeat protein [Candidatus Krumholzibacteria bacterium]